MQRVRSIKASSPGIDLVLADARVLRVSGEEKLYRRRINRIEEPKRGRFGRILCLLLVGNGSLPRPEREVCRADEGASEQDEGEMYSRSPRICKSRLDNLVGT